MINSKLSKKSLKKRSLKLKNKRTKKSKVSRKNVRNMKGGEITKERQDYLLEIALQCKKDFIEKMNLTIEKLQSKIRMSYNPAEKKEKMKEMDNLISSIETKTYTSHNDYVKEYFKDISPEEEKNFLINKSSEIIKHNLSFFTDNLKAFQIEYGMNESNEQNQINRSTLEKMKNSNKYQYPRQFKALERRIKERAFKKKLQEEKKERQEKENKRKQVEQNKIARNQQIQENARTEKINKYLKMGTPIINDVKKNIIRMSKEGENFDDIDNFIKKIKTKIPQMIKENIKLKEFSDLDKKMIVFLATEDIEKFLENFKTETEKLFELNNSKRASRASMRKRYETYLQLPTNEEREIRNGFDQSNLSNPLQRLNLGPTSTYENQRI
jgi:hypothetical protein